MSSTLTFESLEAKVESSIPDDPISVRDLTVPWAWWIAWLGAVVALATVKLWHWFGMQPQLALAVVLGAVYVEIGGFLICLVIPLTRGIRGLKDQRRNYAKELDKANGEIAEVIAWLRRYPSDERRSLLRFVEALRDGMSYRMGLVLGGFERLGMFPIILAVYFQLKDVKGGLQSTLTDINGAAYVCLFLALGLYVAGWLLARHKMQLNGYIRFLSSSLLDSTEGDGRSR